MAEQGGRISRLREVTTLFLMHYGLPNLTGLHH